MRYHVRVTAIDTDHTVPGRFTDAGIRELVGALGGPAEADDIDGALREAFLALDETELGERLLDAVLLQPPIPAGCAALVEAMQDPATPPWRHHDVPSDRFWLWYAHRLLHRALPEQFPAPSVTRVTLDVTPLEAGARPPGPRTPVRDRVTFLAHLLSGRDGGDRPADADPFTRHADDADTDEEWAFDVVWAAEVQGRSTPDPAELAALGVPSEDAAIGRWVRITLAGWMPDAAATALRPGTTWVAEA